MKLYELDWRIWHRVVSGKEMGMQCPMENAEHAEVLLDYCARELSGKPLEQFERHLRNANDARRFARVRKPFGIRSTFGTPNLSASSSIGNCTPGLRRSKIGVGGSGCRARDLRGGP